MLSFLPFDFNFDFSGSTTEILILVGIFLFFFFIALGIGKGKTIALIFSYYPALFFYSQFPFADKLTILKSDWQFFLNKFGIFLIFFIPTFFIINLITGKTLAYTDRSRKFGLAVLGLCASILSLITIHQIIPFEKLTKYFPMTADIWSSESLLFWLLIAPVVLILLFVRR